MIKLAKKIEDADFLTHAGTFHADDVFATVFLDKLFNNKKVMRVKEVPSNIKDNVIVYDIGFGCFDHHGADALWRNDKIKYCSFGLLWKEYGKTYLKNITNDYNELWEAIDNSLVMQIDGIDNGVFPIINAPYSVKDLVDVIEYFNKAWNEEGDNDQQFLKACQVAEMFWERILLKEQAKIEAKKIIEQKLKNMEGNILILDKYMPYHDALFETEEKKAKDIKIIIFPSNREGFNIKPRTIAKDSKKLIVNFPQDFWGLHDQELQVKTGIKSAIFVHATGFLASCGTLDDAIKLANMAIENKE